MWWAAIIIINNIIVEATATMTFSPDLIFNAKF
jgi:hypothetical protein